jgi:phosphate:Na+ symporter
MFLLGIHHLTEGLKGLSGDSLRRILQKVVSGRFSAVLSGALLTVATQSSTATILTVMGFIGAGLITLPQAIAVNIGATVGTTSTPWMVAYFGLRLRISTAALPILGVGALLWLIARGRTRSLGAVLAGFGLIFIGIDFLQDGMAGIHWDLEKLAGTGRAAKWMLAGVGIVMTVVMQSSSAAAATTLVALNTGSLTFGQGCAMVVGQAVGTAATTALAVIGGSVAVRRAAFAHIIYSLITGVVAMVFLTPLISAAAWVGARLHDPTGVLALAAFSSIFKLAGVVAFYPWLDAFSGFVVRISGKGSVSAVSRLDPTVARAGGAVALEASWRAILEVAHGAVDAVRRRLAGEAVKFRSGEAIGQIESFLESLSLETTDLGTIGPRLVRLAHGLDHLTELNEDLANVAPVGGDFQAPAGFEASARALAAWLDATQDPEAEPEDAIFMALQEASNQLGAERKAGREEILKDVALQRIPAATARARLETLAWANGAVYHAWHLAESLRIASGK